MRQGWEDGCEGVGQLRRGLFALVNACHLSTIACVCKEAVVGRSNAEVMTPVMWPAYVAFTYVCSSFKPHTDHRFLPDLSHTHIHSYYTHTRTHTHAHTQPSTHGFGINTRSALFLITLSGPVINDFTRNPCHKHLISDDILSLLIPHAPRPALYSRLFFGMHGKYSSCWQWMPWCTAADTAKKTGTISMARERVIRRKTEW